MKPFDAKKIALDIIKEYEITKEDFELQWKDDDGDTIHETITDFYKIDDKVEEVLKELKKYFEAFK